MSSRVYIGNVPRDTRERDVEHFFRGYGSISDIRLKRGFGFVDFDNYRDAEDAVNDLDGKRLLDSPISVEHTRGLPRGRDRRKPASQPLPKRTNYRVVVQNLSSRINWQDLKNFVSKVAPPTFADAHKKFKNEGIVEFASQRDLKKVIAELDGAYLNGRHIRMTEDEMTRSKRSRTRSESDDGIFRSRSRSYEASEGRSGSSGRSRSSSRGRRNHRSDARRSRSYSNEPRNGRDRSASYSRELKNGGNHRSRSGSRDDRNGKNPARDSGSRSGGNKSRKRSRSSRSPVRRNKKHSFSRSNSRS